MFFSAKAAFLDSLREGDDTEGSSSWFTSDETTCATERTANSSDHAYSSAQKSPQIGDDDEEDQFSRHIFETRQQAVSTFLTNYHNDLYQVLGISFTATKLEIRRAFKSLSLDYHPDKIHSSQNNQPKDYVQILQAYNILSSETLRPIYDEQGYQAAIEAMQS